MAGRRLTQKQSERIQAQQDKRASRLQERDATEGSDLTPPQEGLVVARYGKRADIEPRDGSPVVRCHLRANLLSTVTGDRVAWRRQSGEDEGVVVAVLPRHTELLRPDNYGKLKAVAANIDNVMVVFAPLPAPSSALLDRYLCAGEASGFRPVLVLNKSDLLAPDGSDEASRLASLYAGIGYTVLHCSSRNAHGLDALQAALRTHTSIFVGQSGVGKSSLVNALHPEAGLATQEISDSSGLGQHTTTTARLFHLPGGGDLIDSPGVREFQLWHVSEGQLEDGYIDFAPFRGHCRFRDCRHLREPGCALRTAVERSELSAERLDNFLRIRESLKDAPEIHP